MAGPANFLLQQIAQGAQPRMADAAARGYGQGNELLKMQQQQQTRNALSQAAPMLAQGNLQGAMQSLGNAGEFEPAYKLYGDQQASEQARLTANKPMSTIGKLRGDLQAGRITQDEYRTGIEGIRMGRMPAFITVGNDLYRTSDLANGAGQGPQQQAPQGGGVPMQGVAPQPLIRGPEKRVDTPQSRYEAASDVKRLDKFRGGIDAAQGLRATLAQMKALRQKVSFEGGFMPGAQAAIGGFFGTEEGGAAQALQSLATDVQLQFTNETKGAISDKEMALFASATPGLQMADRGADLVMAGMDAGAQRTVERALFAEEWFNATGNLRGMEAAWDKFVQQNPVFVQDQNTDGGFRINQDNIGGWQRYIPSGQQGASQQQAAPQRGVSDPAQAAIGTGNTPDEQAAITGAINAIQRGADPAMVRQRLEQFGIDPAVLD